MHHTKEKGDLGNLQIMANLALQGFKILTPMSEHLPFDFVVFDESTGKLMKVQSKFKSLRDGILSVNLQTCYSDSKKTVSTRYEEGAFDILAIYCPDIEKVVYILNTDLQDLSRSVNFSITKGRGKRYVDDYTDIRKLLA